MAFEDEAHRFGRQGSGVSRPRRWPGMTAASVIAALAGLAGWGGMAALRDGGQAGSSLVERVADADLRPAFMTVAHRRNAEAQLAQKKACEMKVASVTVMGPPGTSLRLQSGSYISPLFPMTGAPVRIALPFPAAYDSGAGVLAAMTTDSDITVALRPAWHIERSGRSERPVHWIPVERCPGA